MLVSNKPKTPYASFSSLENNTKSIKPKRRNFPDHQNRNSSSRNSIASDISNSSSVNYNNNSNRAFKKPPKFYIDLNDSDTTNTSNAGSVSSITHSDRDNRTNGFATRNNYNKPRNNNNQDKKPNI